MAYPGSSFVEPTTPGDAVSVFVLVEDSSLLAAKWGYMRDFVLPVLLDTLRKADPTSPMRAFWCTTAPTSTPSTTSIAGVDEGIQIPDFNFDYASGSPISMAHVRRAIDILAAGTGSRRITRHLIIVAASRLRDSVMSSHTSQSGNDPWENLALSLSQEYIRLHMVLSSDNETNNFHGLFKRLLQLERNTEVPVWFPVDSRLLTIRLSGKPMRAIEGIYGLPEESVSEVPAETQEMYSSSASPPSLPSSPSSDSVGPIRRHTAPMTTSRKARASEDASPPIPEGMGLVTYLQQLHGLTKKRSYGLKAPKRTLTADVRPGAARPILPRLEVSTSTPYTYPTFKTVESRASASPTTIVSPGTMQPQPTSDSAAAEDRRARRQGPWLPVRPFQSSVPTSSAPSASNISALRALESMARRLPDVDRRPAPASSMSFVNAAPAYPANPPQPSYAHVPNSLSPPNYASAASSPASPLSSEPSPIHMSSAPDAEWRLADPAQPPPRQYAYAGVPYGASPISSASATSLPSPALGAPPATEPGTSAEDAPFVITPEYEALANARFEEAVRSGALQASMTVASTLPSGSPALPAVADPLPRLEAYAPMAQYPQYPQYPSPPSMQTTREQPRYDPPPYPPPQNATHQWNAPMIYTQQVPQYGPPPTWYGP
ncbi:hypothetical protein OBBRIDRAFT_887749 [Obba rivulosa]|uniref:Uncharacterized protein n=1 Tax=Obba rivulosa TaxID=1052685 RepID=A0A8E2DJG9_9APHY|nr:hypothetical protein OBBRIDRAFT_887749 [Obba rivulosa]